MVMATTTATTAAPESTEATISTRTAYGRFRIDGTLGRGGMAVVYLAHDTELGRPVAVKVLADHGMEDHSFRARFAREARIAAGLTHPNVVQVFDVGEEAGRPFIVMEYVEGETLGDELRRERRLAPARVIDVARQCCAGLACAHAAGLVHRDIKPQNLLVTADGAVKIADFGVAHALDQTRLTLTGSIVGTARYLAPYATVTVVGREARADGSREYGAHHDEGRIIGDLSRDIVWSELNRRARDGMTFGSIESR